MAKQGFLSPTNAGKSLQLNNFALKFPTYRTMFGFTLAEQTEAADDAAAWAYALQVQQAYQTASQSTTAYLNSLLNGSPSPIGGFPTGIITLPAAPTAVPAGIVDRFLEKAHVAKAKKSVYNTTIGEDWGIEGTDDGIIDAFLKPDIKITLNVGLPVLHVKKIAGRTVDLYKAIGNAAFEYFANTPEANFTDENPLPTGTDLALVKYKGIYKKGNQQVGIISEEAAVAVVRPV